MGRDEARRTAVVIMGVSGSGKTTLAETLAARLGWPVAEADDFHSTANVAKMSSGVALTDEDRAPWLISIRDWINAADTSVLLTCSALRRRYRDILRTANARVRFLHLDDPHGLIEARMRARTDHFMPPALLASQLAALEPLEPDEDGVVIEVAGSPQQIADQALEELGLLPS